MYPEKVIDLLERWHELRAQGRPIDVAELCPECPELADTLARLVRAVKVTDWLEERCDDVGAVPRLPVSPEELGLPRKVGRYELRELIGEGGFGYVFRAYDPELQRPVAVKVARPSRTASPEETERFLDEARRAAQLKHASIVPVHDVGRDGPWLYIVSDLVDGCDLGATLRLRRMPVAESAQIVARVADALECAHRNGLVHRDVKPANILLDREGNVFLTDFGIAVTREQLEDGAIPVEGTLAYMAPEQLVPTDGQVGPPSDVYSLGVVLYELLTERRPTRGKCSGVPPPSTLDPSIPTGIDAVCLRALAAAPTERFASAAEFAQAIRGALVERRRHRIVPALAALTGAILVLAMALVAGQRFLLPRPPPLAEEQRHAAGPAETIDQPSTETAGRDARGNPPRQAADGSRDGAKQPEQIATQELGGSPAQPKTDGSREGTGRTVVVVKAPLSPQDYVALVEDLNSVDFGRRNQAIKRLLEEKPRRHAVAVAKALERVLLEDDHPSLRANAALALASWGTAESTAALKKAAARDTSAIVQSRAKNAIEAIKRRQ